MGGFRAAVHAAMNVSGVPWDAVSILRSTLTVAVKPADWLTLSRFPPSHIAVIPVDGRSKLPLVGLAVLVVLFVCSFATTNWLSSGVIGDILDKPVKDSSVVGLQRFCPF